MPELPEVEVFRRFVDRWALKRPIQACHVLTPKILENLSQAQLKKAVTGKRFTETRRQGKHLLVRLEGNPAQWLFLHFGMTGYLGRLENGREYISAYGQKKRPGEPHRHVRVQFDFEDGTALLFHEQRMFGKLGMTDDPDAYIRSHKLGPDALSISEPDFLAALRRKKGQLKPVLMDQSWVAGIGNVYADEIMFQCRLSPLRPVSALAEQDLRCLYRQMREVLQNTVDCAADRDQLPAHYLLHHRHKKARCPQQCGPVEIQTLGGRTTYFCPQCQQ